MALFQNMLKDDEQAQRLRIAPPPVLYPQSPNRDICPHDRYIKALIPCPECKAAKKDGQK